MEWIGFLNKVKDEPFIELRRFLLAEKNSSYVRLLFYRWAKSEKLIKLKKGLYILNEPYRRSLNLSVIACFLKQPSYLSLEKALEFHGLIPESVFVYTLVSPKRSYNFDTEIGRFHFRQIRKDLFFGYKGYKDKGCYYFIADPEKTIIDYLYFKAGQNNFENFIEEMRFQNLSILNLKKFISYSQKFPKKFQKIFNYFINYARKELDDERFIA